MWKKVILPIVIAAGLTTLPLAVYHAYTGVECRVAAFELGQDTNTAYDNKTFSCKYERPINYERDVEQEKKDYEKQKS